MSGVVGPFRVLACVGFFSDGWQGSMAALWWSRAPVSGIREREDGNAL